MATLARIRVFPQLAWYAGDDGANNRYNNCGPAAACAVMEYATWQRWTPDAVHDWMRGESYLGYTYVSDIVRFLRAHGLDAVAVKVTSEGALRDLCRREIAAGHPLIYLSYFNLYTRAGGHFTVVRRADKQAGLINSYGAYPSSGWTRLYETWSWANMWSNAQKTFGDTWVVTVNHRHKSGYRLFATRVNHKCVLQPYMNVRKVPRLDAAVVGRMLPGTSALFTQYTHDGDAWRGSTLWRYSARLGGWVHSAGTVPA